MRRIFTAVFVFATLFSVAQDDSTTTSSRKQKKEVTYRFHVSLEGGPAFPLSDYGDRNVDENHPKSGLALTGLGARLRAGYEILPGLLAVADGIWFYNPGDAKTLLNSITSNPNNPQQLKYKVTTSAWQIYGAMAGAAWKLNLEETECEFRLMPGIVKGKYSGATYSATDGVTTQTIVESADDVTAFAMNLGFTFRLKLRERMGVSISGDYFVTELNFDNIKLTDSDGTVFNSGAYAQPVSVFQVGAGVYFKF